MRLATLGVERLLARGEITTETDHGHAAQGARAVDATRFEELHATVKKITGLAVRALNGVRSPQEIEGVDALEHVRSMYRRSAGTPPHGAGVRGRDLRLIEVAVPSCLPIAQVRSCLHMLEPGDRDSTSFSRGWLEADITTGGHATAMAVSAQHLKSTSDRRNAARSLSGRAGGVRQILIDSLDHMLFSGSPASSKVGGTTITGEVCATRHSGPHLDGIDRDCPPASVLP